MQVAPPLGATATRIVTGTRLVQDLRGGKLLVAWFVAQKSCSFYRIRILPAVLFSIRLQSSFRLFFSSPRTSNGSFDSTW